MAGEGEGPLFLGAVALAEFLHLVAALGGGLGWGGVGAAAGDGGGNRVPVGGAEVAAAEYVPPVTVGFDQGEGFGLGPARGWEFTRGFLCRRRRRRGHDLRERGWRR